MLLFGVIVGGGVLLLLLLFFFCYRVDVVLLELIYLEKSVEVIELLSICFRDLVRLLVRVHF